MSNNEGLTAKTPSVILVSPNVSEQMGGEAIKALQIYLELSRQGVNVHQITHERVKEELERKFPGMRVSYVKDTGLQKAIHRIPPLAPFLNLIFQWRAARVISGLLSVGSDSVVHFTAPVSPVLPYFRIRGAAVVIGPLNGNIHYPASFRHREMLPYRVRRWLHPVLQFLSRHTFSGKQSANAILVAGGGRTYESLRLSGCRERQFVDSIDSGVLDDLSQTPRINHTGRNLRFFQNGRLVDHKGTDLVIRSLARTKNPVTLDVIGRGPALAGLKKLVTDLHLENRVHFIEWVADHSKLAEMLREYRAFVFPSLAEANGIVVQEAMVQGLPVVALNWGGPGLLVTPDTGVLIEPRSEEYVIDELAGTLDLLSEDGDLAERMSIAARARAIEDGYLWSGVIRRWRRVYQRVLGDRAAGLQLSNWEPSLAGSSESASPPSKS
jgi:glycosyltransferase involved in cell wall biosynthesis